MKLIIFDFEVYKYDTLLGALVINKEPEVFQSWNLDEIKKFYHLHENDIWIGHNNQHYDNFILESIIKERDPYLTSKKIINDEYRKKYIDIKLYNYDLINNHFGSLKAIEASDGKNISESEVDFDIQRNLTEKEKEIVEEYNLDDLSQTLDNFNATQNEFILRLEIIKEFNLNLNCLSITGTQLAEKVLGAKKIEGIENQKISPKIYDDMLIENKDLINYYLNEGFRKGEILKLNLCGVEHTFRSGGLHGARKKFHKDWAFYFDVTGYYNLVMILKDLLSRTIPKEGKELYNYMYQQQLILKKTNPLKRQVFKIILLAVFGAMNNKYCNFYDPEKGSLVTMVGQMYIADLLEKLQDKAEVIQTNTDGIIAYPINNTSEEELVQIIKDWMNRTGFNLKLIKIFDIYQRDVNNYMYREEDGKIVTRGEAVKYYNHWKNSLDEDVFKSREPVILHYTTVEFFMNNKLPEEVIEEYKNEPRMFQYICKVNSYDYLEYEVKNLETGEKNIKKLQNVNRAFACNSNDTIGMIYKVKESKRDKFQSLPNNIFVYNNEILSNESIEKLQTKINYQYYIERAYERISEFIEIPEIKDIIYE